MSQSPQKIETTKKERLLIRQNNSNPQAQSTELPRQQEILRQTSERAVTFNRNIIRLGVCAMDKKTSCKPMQEILDRLNASDDIALVIFPEPVILLAPIQEWPIVDCLITFYSSGFPLSKAEAYIELRKPYLINELKFQESMLWRNKVYDILVQHGIPVPKHYVFMDEATVKKAKKYHPSSNNLVSLEDGNSSQASNLSNSKFTFKLTDDVSESEMKGIGKQVNALEKDTTSPKPFIHRKFSDSVITPITLPEEEKVEYKDKAEPTFQNLSRQHSQSSLAPTQDIKCETNPVRRKFSEHYTLSKVSVNENQIEEDTNRQEGFKSPLSNYYRKYHTKIEEHDDFILIGDHKLKKPFVEKPLSAEDHEINIYYPKCDGGGCKCLFRKTDNVSSSFDPNSNQVRTGGSYIYEEFLPTDGFDIKVYTVGPNYAHAETRKSPVLDGVVQRTKEGKEVRFPINLTHEEKIIAKKIVFAFDQQICGFDLLRSKGKSYVCDVNGWSFVKGNAKYYTDCAVLIRGMILAKFAPERLTPLNPILSQLNKIKYDVDSENLFRPSLEDRSSFDKEELRSVVAIFRHGDRTPKQKMKMITVDHRYLSLFDDQDDTRKEVKIKTVKQLQRVLDMTQEIIEEFYSPNSNSRSAYSTEMVSKHFQLFSVLKKGGHFEGINRKIQLKPLEWEQKVVNTETNEVKEKVTKGLFILKWGGELTHAGIEQAEELGAIFRNQVYPKDNEGLLRLHSTYRHDLKIYSSQEGRCQKTAAAFCKGLLELEGDLRPIAVSMVRKDEMAQEMLEFEKVQESHTIHDLKDRLPTLLHSDEELYDLIKQIIGEENMDSKTRKILKDVGKPRALLVKTHELVKKLSRSIKKIIATDEDSYYLSLTDMGYGNTKLQDIKTDKKPDAQEQKCEEVSILIYKRWKKLESDFYKPKEGTYDISKVPDIYYSIRYDILHSKRLYEANKEICIELLECAQKLSNFVIPAEYGLTDQERIGTSLHIVTNLLKKVTHDLIWWNAPFLNQAEQVGKDEQSFFEHRGLDPAKVGEDVKSLWRHVRTRLYFTSASHLHSLYNVISMGLKLFYPGTDRFRTLPLLKTLDYLSHVMIRLYENLNANHEDPNRFRLEIMLSQGCKIDDFTFGDKKEHQIPVAPSIVLSSQLTLKEIEEFLNGLLKLGNESGMPPSPSTTETK